MPTALFLYTPSPGLKTSTARPRPFDQQRKDGDHQRVRQAGCRKPRRSYPRRGGEEVDLRGEGHPKGGFPPFLLLTNHSNHSVLQFNPINSKKTCQIIQNLSLLVLQFPFHIYHYGI